MASMMDSKRVRIPTAKGKALYEEGVQRFNSILIRVKSDIETLINSCFRKELSGADKLSVKHRLMQDINRYEKVSGDFITYLEGQRTLAAENERSAQIIVKDSLRSKVQVFLANYIVLSSDKGTTSNSSNSRLSTVVLNKQAELDAIRTKKKYLESMTELQKQKAELEAKMDLLLIQEEEEKCEKELEFIQEDYGASVTESLSGVKYSRTVDFIDYVNDHMHIDECNLNVENDIFEPPLQFRDEVNGHDDIFQSNYANDYDSYHVSYNDCPSTTYPVATPIRNIMFPIASMSDVTQSNVYNDQTQIDNHECSVSNDVSNQTYVIPSNVNISSNHGNSNQKQNDSSQLELCKIMTQMMARKDVVLTRLVKYNDSPMQYISWKSTFKEVISELGMSSAEELDLLIRWLGPESSKQAESIKVACVGNSINALAKVWDRLETRYGSVELVQECLRNKVKSFPKLTNSITDCKKLFELHDILCEIDCVKRDSKYQSVFSYYDSSLGINEIVSHLPYNLQEKWSSEVNKFKRSHDRQFPPFSHFIEFVFDMARWRTDPSLYRGEQKTRTGYTGQRPTTQVVSARKTDAVTGERSGPITIAKPSDNVCPLHGTNHTLNRCKQFRSKPMAERIELLKKYKLCFRCCSLKRHLRKKCRERVLCDVCKSSEHPSALHPDVVASSEPAPHGLGTEGLNRHGGEGLSELSSNCTQICGSVNGIGKSCAKILPVIVHPESRPDLAQKVYALIDDQSNRSLVTPHLLDKIGENGEFITYCLSTCSGKLPTSGRITKAYTVTAMDGGISIRIPSLIECADIPNNTQEIPTPEVARNHSHLRCIADYLLPIEPEVNVEILIGRDVVEAHYVLDQRVGGHNLPYAQKLPLGWVVIGETCLGEVHRNDDIRACKTSILPNGRNTVVFKSCESKMSVDPIFQKTAMDETIGPSIEDRAFLDLMDTNLTIDADGRWSALLPFRKERTQLPNNKLQALQRVKSLDRSLERDPVKKEHVLNFMQRMLDKGHAERAPKESPGNEYWYLPFFGIYHPKKPDSIRVVFDSSAKYDGICLNDVLMKGPDLTNSLLGVLLRFRKEAVAVMADVEQMFYNFRVDKPHRDYLRFIWHEGNNLSAPYVDHQMTVHVFGNSPSPAISTYALRRSVNHAEEDVQDFIHHSFYVDDGLLSCPDEQYAIDLVKRTQQALDIGGKLRLHKIVSNSRTVLQSFESLDLAKDLKDLDLGSDTPPVQRSLGLSWDISTDHFVFNISSEQKPYTKRGALSTVNSLFDPLGFVAPVTLCGKLLLRKMMASSGPVMWDEELSDSIKRPWEDWIRSLKYLEDLRIPRRFCSISFSGSDRKEIHIFSDASKEAIASVAYLKLYQQQNCEVSFLLGKAKVAPVQGHTIPRLELCAAVLSVELADIIRDELQLDPSTFHYYTDSRVVLGYLSNETRRFYVYVSNRVSRIRASSSPRQWHYVSTEENPADVASRGINAHDLPETTYLSGPLFLRQNNTIRPEEYTLIDPDQDAEIRPDVIAVKTLLHPRTHSSWSERFARFSCWDSLVRALTLLKKVIRSLHNESVPSRFEVELTVIRLVQNELYQSEIDTLKKAKHWPVSSSLSPLTPFLDSSDVLRVGGRLKRASNLSQNFHPVIVPKKHHIAVLLVRHYHNKTYHQGRHITEGSLRAAGYWIVGNKRLVVSVIRQCVSCKRMRGRFCTQLMADLPVDRLQPGPPFTYVGVDTFGPWPVSFRRTRGGGANQKRWALLFTCLVSRSIHIEVIEELSSSCFINAFRRFISIRGPVKVMRSDRGTNFVGAIQDLGISYEFVENGPVDRVLGTQGTIWKFNPPHASHFGSAWERMIGLCRRILDGMLPKNQYKLTPDVLNTLMAEVCSIVNSRPLTSVSSDPEDPDILSPSRLLTQKVPTNDYVFPQFGKKDMIRSQWKLVQGMADEFWNKWLREFVHNLQPRKKWQSCIKNLQPGDIVIMRDKEIERTKWPLAIVERSFESEDKLVRKVEISVIKNGRRQQYVRPISELVPLIEMV